MNLQHLPRSHSGRRSIPAGVRRVPTQQVTSLKWLPLSNSSHCSLPASPTLIHEGLSLFFPTSSYTSLVLPSHKNFVQEWRPKAFSSSVGIPLGQYHSTPSLLMRGLRREMAILQQDVLPCFGQHLLQGGDACISNKALLISSQKQIHLRLLACPCMHTKSIPVYACVSTSSESTGGSL